MMDMGIYANVAACGAKRLQDATARVKENETK
jgi:hypothetical protein